MANTKISNLTGAASVTDASVFPVVDSGSTKKVTGTQIKTYARAGLSTVAVSGSYNDLSNKPSLFSGAYADLTGKPTLFDGNYNSLTNKPTIPDVSGFATTTYVDTAVSGVTVPTNTSQLTNDAGFITTWGQADWNEEITESPSYIQNKPQIVHEIIAGVGLHTEDDRITGNLVMYANIPNVTVVTPYNSLTGLTNLRVKPRSSPSYSNIAIISDATPIDIDLAPNIKTANANFTGTMTAANIEVVTGIKFADNTIQTTAYTGQSGGGASTGNITFSDTTLTSTNGDVKIHFEPSASPAVEFNFSQSGNLTIPSNLVCNGHMNIVTTQYNDIDLYTNDWNGGGVEVWLQHNDKVSISTDNGNYTWNFTNNGEFQFPNNVKQVNTGTVICDANMDTVIYTGTTQYQHTFKLLLKVEGMENDGQTGWDTQSCEMMIAKSFRNDAVAGSVYGLVYTSTNPLATFTTRWNASTSRIEVLCRPTSTLYGVEVRSFVTEMPTSD